MSRYCWTKSLGILPFALPINYILDKDKRSLKFYSYMDEGTTAVETTLRDKEFLIISGTASKKLASDICKELGIPLGAAKMERFSDGEIFVRFNESLREKDVFIVQTCAPPVNDNVMELLLSIAAAKRSGGNKFVNLVNYNNKIIN